MILTINAIWAKTLENVFFPTTYKRAYTCGCTKSPTLWVGEVRDASRKRKGFKRDLMGELVIAEQGSCGPDSLMRVRQRAKCVYGQE